MSKTRERGFYWCRYDSNQPWTIAYWNGVYWNIPEKDAKTHKHTFEELFEEIEERPIVREETKPKFENLDLP